MLYILLERKEIFRNRFFNIIRLVLNVTLFFMFAYLHFYYQLIGISIHLNRMMFFSYISLRLIRWLIVLASIDRYFASCLTVHYQNMSSISISHKNQFDVLF